ncbi:tyrosine-type recombinase/integrase [Haloferax sulfurifontis]|uniref:Integrase n=1 Tax=Haloferax sulfurifontis ATCC BAA-897 TaxID=662480 RepID=M0I6S7_9EURY|nr:site-specific integrase [Haloferax sulfurifontis]ELZ91144.1 integrase [Haloferax sulfurifontis ATCC BAA-897]
MIRNEKGKFEQEYTLDQYEGLYDDYEEWVDPNADKETTSDRLKAGVRAWLFWCEENQIDPFEVEENDVRSYIVEGLSKYADTTLIRRVATVSKYYHYHLHDPNSGVEIEENPTAEINLRRDYDVRQTAEYVRVLSRQGRSDVIALPFEKIKLIFSEVEGKDPISVRNELICRLLWQTALRSDELSRIRIDNIDFEERDIKIRSSKLNQEDHPKLYHRHVWWEKNLDRLMFKWLETHRSRSSKYAEESPYLFLTSHSDQMRPTHISRIVKEAAHSAGIQEPLTRKPSGEVKQWLITAHRLRHSRITQLVNETDMDLNWVRMMAGHAKIDTTLKYVREDWGLAHDAYRDALEE